MTKKINKQNEFRKVKASYLDPALLEIIKEEGFDVANYVSKIQNVVIGQTYTIIGYGSLMKRSDARRNLRNIISFKNATINGYRRIFNAGKMMSGAYLNVEQDTTENNGFDRMISMTVAAITIDAEDMLSFIYRERGYEMVEVDYTLYNSTEGGSAYMVMVKNPLKLKAAIEPMLTYVSLCNAGAKELMTDEQYVKYLEETITIKHGERISLNGWMLEFDLMRYLNSHIHTPR